MSAHTPGPWEFHYMQGANILLPLANNLACGIAMQLGDGTDGQLAANVRLISEAPAMAQALRDLFEHCAMIHKHWGDGCNLREANAAEARARAILARLDGLTP